jgi:hypothetical protein
MARSGGRLTAGVTTGLLPAARAAEFPCVTDTIPIRRPCVVAEPDDSRNVADICNAAVPTEADTFGGLTETATDVCPAGI